MTVAQDYTTLSSNGNLRLDWYPTNAFANWQAPTVTEANSGLNISKAVSWSDYGFGMQASNTTDDPSIADTGHTKSRGSAQYGGAISFYHPALSTLPTDLYRLAQAAIGIPRTTGYVITRLDGAKPSNQAYAAGDLISVFLVETDGQTNVITGEESFRYTVKFVSQGSVARNVVVRSGTVAVVPTSTSTSVTVGGHTRIPVKVNGREYTNGVVWTSSDSTIATASTAGVITGHAAGTATLTATYTPTAATGTITVTVA